MDGLIFGIFFALCLLWVLPVGVAHSISQRKVDSDGWIWGLFLGWIGVIIVAKQPDRQNFVITSLSTSAIAPLKLCPDCAESVERESIVCRYCGHRWIDSKNS